MKHLDIIVGTLMLIMFVFLICYLAKVLLLDVAVPLWGFLLFVGIFGGVAIWAIYKYGKWFMGLIKRLLDKEKEG